MGIELFWDNDDETVILCVFDKELTWDEMFQTFDDIKKVTRNRDSLIGAIIDVSQGVSVPGGSIFNADTRAKAMQMLRMGGEEKGPLAIVGANGFIKSIYHAVGTLDRKAQKDIYFADTLNEARAILSKRLAPERVESVG
ncbi:MAG: hypothetical protein RLP44_30880 [Aggregatilineales bacterium]